MSCTACVEARAYGVPKTEAERLATHSTLYGTTNLPPRGTGILKTMGCEVCGQIMKIPTGVKSFTCPYCNSIYDITTPTLEDTGGWVWPFLAGAVISAIIFTSVGRAMVRTLSEATLTELQSAAARRKARIAAGKKAEVW